MTEKKNEIAVAKNISEAVLAKVQTMQETGGLVLPEDYHAGNALNAAYLKFKQLEDKNHKPAEQVCSKESVALALMDMVIQGLSPAKNQCYFVVHGSQLTLMRSYMGTVAAAKRFGGVKSVHAQVVYKNDDFGFEIDPSTGTKKVTVHEQSLESIEEGTIRAAYAVVITKDDVYYEIMTMDEIRKAWAQGAAKGGSPAHKNFPQEMAKKTVINRACKIFVNTSTDADPLADAYNRTTANDYIGDEFVDTEAEELNESAFDAIMAEDEREDDSAEIERSELEFEPVEGMADAEEVLGA